MNIRRGTKGVLAVTALMMVVSAPALAAVKTYTYPSTKTVAGTKQLANVKLPSGTSNSISVAAWVGCDNIHLWKARFRKNNSFSPDTTIQSVEATFCDIGIGTVGDTNISSSNTYHGDFNYFVAGKSFTLSLSSIT